MKYLAETQNSGDFRKFVCVWFLEVPAEAQLIISSDTSQSIIERSDQSEGKKIKGAIVHIDIETPF
jgi:hypothetical protein